MIRSITAVNFSSTCAVLAVAFSAAATPPDYATLNRAQRANIEIVAGDVMRIWVAYVGQGDGILIQLPEHLNRGGEQGGERVDILIDGGSNSPTDADRMRDLIEQLYPDQDEIDIEHAVITHHDQDHVLGLTRILDSPDIGVEHMYHNGLASFAAGKRGLPLTGRPQQSGVYDFDARKNAIKRALGLLGGNEALLPAFVMDDLAELRQSQHQGELQGVYDQLARAITDKASPHKVRDFNRAHIGGRFIGEFEAAGAPAGLGDVSFEVVWPPSALHKYGSGWGETINGNSVTFRLRYRDFEMLFTGDQNEQSEQALLEEMQQRGTLGLLGADVLKVPHHGSKHGIEAFFSAVSPVMSVASQGLQGAKSKQISGRGAWEHPSPEVIGWLGGPHRVYLTELHERRFDWEGINTPPKLQAMKEHSHVVIETDGVWFRVVEVPADGDSIEVPAVESIHRGDGTRWIRAR